MGEGRGESERKVMPPHLSFPEENKTYYLLILIFNF